MWTERVKDAAETVLGWLGVLDDQLPRSYADGARPPAFTPLEAPPSAAGDPDAHAAPAVPASLLAELDAGEAEAAAGGEAWAPLDSLGGRALTVENVEAVLDELVRPALNADGGDITLVKIEDIDIYVRLVGACSTCPSSVMTMKMGVERLLQDEFPQMGDLIQVSDGLWD
jgi:Fe-S cluster biogenesis protein NfuA